MHVPHTTSYNNHLQTGSIVDIRGKMRKLKYAELAVTGTLYLLKSLPSFEHILDAKSRFALCSFQLILALTEFGGVRSLAVQSVWAQFWWPRTVQSLTWHLTSAKCQALPEASALLARLVEPSSSNVANLQFTLPPRLMFHRFSKVLLRKQGHSHPGNPARNNDPFHAKCHKKLKCERLLGFFQLFFGFL